MAAQLKNSGTKDTNTDRLNKLALPNCHLVEAVLKEHYHVFNDDCRDRLKKLLEVILTVNGSSKKFEKFDEHFKINCIKNLKRRLENLEEAQRKKVVDQVGDHVDEKDNLEMHVLFKSAKSNEHGEVTDCGDHSENDRESYITADTKFIEGEMRSKKPYEWSSEEQKSLCLKQFHYLKKLFAEFNFNFDETVVNSSTPTHHEKQSKVLRRKSLRRRSNVEKIPDDDCKAEGDGVRVKRKKKVVFKEPLVEQEDTKKFKEAGDIPSLAVKYYVALLTDMKRNSKLYDDFIKIAIQPVESYQQRYIKAAYKCWMEYFNYNKYTLDYLHPYIKDLVQTSKLYNPGHPMMIPYETKLPIVLIDGIKNMKPWRKTLEETVQYCDHLARSGKHTEVSWKIHQLYIRHYQKIDALKTKKN